MCRTGLHRLEIFVEICASDLLRNDRRNARLPADEDYCLPPVAILKDSCPQQVRVVIMNSASCYSPGLKVPDYDERQAWAGRAKEMIMPLELKIKGIEAISLD